MCVKTTIVVLTVTVAANVDGGELAQCRMVVWVSQAPYRPVISLISITVNLSLIPHPRSPLVPALGCILAPT